MTEIDIEKELKESFVKAGLDEDEQQRQLTFINDLAEEVKPLVDLVNAAPSVSPFKFVEYGFLISEIAHEDMNVAKVVGVALLKAKADVRGVYLAIAQFYGL